MRGTAEVDDAFLEEIERWRELAQQGKVDAAIGAIPYSEEWEQSVDFTQPCFYSSRPGLAEPGRLYFDSTEKWEPCVMPERISRLDGFR
jgi:ABC-type amino acid transport substrate-binding protein